MQKENKCEVTFLFPPEKSLRGDILATIAQNVKWSKKIGFAGFLKKVELKGYLSGKFSGDLSGYKKMDTQTESKIKQVVFSTIKKCSQLLPTSVEPFFVFLLPWFGSKYDKMFKGVTGFTPYIGVLHIFLTPQKFSLNSVKETVAHEMNHAIFFHYHKSMISSQTLLQTMIFEGLAENFREESVGGKTAAWSSALNVQQCKKYLTDLSPSLSSRDYSLYRRVFFGDKKNKRWAGYSIGYRIVKAFRRKYPDLTWEQIMEMKPEKIFKMSSFMEK